MIKITYYFVIRNTSKKNIKYTKICTDGKPEVWEEMLAKTGRNIVPQIFIGDTHIGGFDDLSEADMDGQLDKLITQ